MSEQIIYKIFNHTADESEKLKFFRSIENDPEKKEEFYRLKNLHVLNNLNPDRYRKQQNESFSKFWNQAQSSKPQRIIGLWMRYAAIFILASVLGFMANYLLNQKDGFASGDRIEYSSERGSVSTIHLEDGSAIWLSSGTRLVIGKNKKGETIARLNGEAYFDLVPDPSRKFVVDVGNFQIKDIGTIFNVRAYKSENSISTTLIKGQIDLIENSGAYILTIKPGEYAKYDKTSKEITVNQKDPSIVTAWKEGKFVFIDQLLSEICLELENWYNVKIHIEDPKLACTRYTSIVKRTTTVQMVLKLLAITDHIKYEITNNKEGKDIIRIRK